MEGSLDLLFSILSFSRFFLSSSLFTSLFLFVQIAALSIQESRGESFLYRA